MPGAEVYFSWDGATTNPLPKVLAPSLLRAFDPNNGIWEIGSDGLLTLNLDHRVRQILLTGNNTFGVRQGVTVLQGYNCDSTPISVW